MDATKFSANDWHRSNHKLAKRNDRRPLVGNNPDAPLSWRNLQLLIAGGTVRRQERSWILQGKDDYGDRG